MNDLEYSTALAGFIWLALAVISAVQMIWFPQAFCFSMIFLILALSFFALSAIAED